MQVLNIVTFNNDYCEGGRFMLDIKRVLISFFVLATIASFIFWALSHAPSKRNKTIKRARMRKWSTISFIVTEVISFLWISLPIPAFILAFSFALQHMVFDKRIENL